MTTFTRVLTPAPGEWNADQLADEVGALAVNTVTADTVTYLAAYWADGDPATLDTAGWTAAVAAHVPAPAAPNAADLLAAADTETVQTVLELLAGLIPGGES